MRRWGRAQHACAAEDCVLFLMTGRHVVPVLFRSRDMRPWIGDEEMRQKPGRDKNQTVVIILWRVKTGVWWPTLHDFCYLLPATKVGDQRDAPVQRKPVRENFPRAVPSSFPGNCSSNARYCRKSSASIGWRTSPASIHEFIRDRRAATIGQ